MTLPIISVRRGGGGKTVLVTAEETASQGMLKQLLGSKQAAAESTHHDETEMHVHRVILLYCTSNLLSALIRSNF